MPFKSFICLKTGLVMGLLGSGILAFAQVNPPHNQMPNNQISNAQYSPVDISSLYTGSESGVPVIIPPKPCGTSKYEISVSVSNISGTKGKIVADLHNDKEEGGTVWNKTILRVRAPAQKGITKFCMPVPKPGTYAIAVYHDKNNDGKFDKGFMHIPKEMFGMSANPNFGLKMPAFKEAEFIVPPSGVHLDIVLRKAEDILAKSKTFKEQQKSKSGLQK